MNKVCWLAFTCLATAGAQQPHAILGNLTTSGAVTINGAAIPASLSPSLPITDQDRLETTESALFTTTEGNRLTLARKSKAKIGTVEGGQTFLYVTAGGVDFQTSARHVYLCIGKRLFVPPTPGRGYARLNAAGTVESHLDQGTFVESGKRACGETGIAGFVTGLLAGAGAGGAAPAAGGIATGAAAGAGAGIGTIGTVAAVAGAAAGVGGAAATGLASSTSVSDCSGNLGCNFNPPPPSASQP